GAVHEELAPTDAIAAGEKYLNRIGGGELFVHSPDGRVAERRTVAFQSIFDEQLPYHPAIDTSHPGAVQADAFRKSYQGLLSATRPLNEVSDRIRQDADRVQTLTRAAEQLAARHQELVTRPAFTEAIDRMTSAANTLQAAVDRTNAFS